MRYSVDFYRNNPLFVIAVMFILGIALGDILMLPFAVYAVLLISAIAIGSWFMRFPIVSSLSVHVGAIIAGAWLVTIAKEYNKAIPVGRHYYEAVVVSQPVITDKSFKCDLWIVNTPEPIKVKATLLRDAQLYGDTLRPGDGLVVSTALKAVADVDYSDGHFDYQRWLRVNHYDATAYVWQDWQREQIKISNLPTMEKIRMRATMWRGNLQENYRRLGLEDRTLALISAMTIGDKSLLDDQMRDEYSISGASHILALSGLHLMVLFAIVNYIMNGIAKFLIGYTGGKGRLTIKFIKALLLFGLIWGFTILVGLSPSITRAATMISLYAVVDLDNRPHQPFNTLAFTALVILLINPLSLWDVGFQLSFMAVLGIFFFQPKRRLNWFLSLLWLSLSAQLAVAPLLLYHFGRLSCYFLLANIVVVPCAYIIVYSAFAVLLLTPVALIQRWMVAILTSAAHIMDSSVRGIAMLPGASIENIHFDGVQVVALYVLIICVYRIFCLTLHSK